MEAEVPPIGRLDDRPASPGRVGDAPRRFVAREQLPHPVAVPALVTRLDGEADPIWERGERLVEPSGLDAHRRGELQKHGSELRPEVAHALGQACDRFSRLAKLPAMREVAARLHRHHEPVRRLVAPAGEDVCCGEPVEGAVDLDRLEAPCVEAQPARHRQVCGVEAARPVAVLPPRRPDPQGRVPFLPRFERASFRPRACRAWACPRTARRRRRRARAWRAGGEGRSWTRRTLAAGQPPSGGAEGGAT